MSLNRRNFIVLSSALTLQQAILGISDAFAAGSTQNLRDAAQKKGIDIGAMLSPGQLKRPEIRNLLSQHFTLAANLGEEIEWDRNYGNSPRFAGLNTFLSTCNKAKVRPRLRQIYSWEALPKRAHLRSDGTPKNKAELERTLLQRVDQVCSRLNPSSTMTIQVMDEILAPAGGGLRNDPFMNALGEEMVDLLFFATRERMPRARLTYQEFGPVGDPNYYFKRKTSDHLKLLKRLKKRGVPITGAAVGGFVFPPSNNQPTLNSGYFRRISQLGLDFHWNELSMIYGKKGVSKTYRPRTQEEHDRRVIKDYSRVVKFMAKRPNTREISFFAPIDDDNILERGTLGLPAYKDARPGLFTKSHQPKPVYSAVVKSLQ